MDFVVDIYKLTKSFPTLELYGLTNQIRRSAVSVPSNIAEGSGRKNTREFIQFLYVSNGSLSELETQLELAHRIGYISNIENIIEKIKHIRKMLINLIRALENKLTSK